MVKKLIALVLVLFMIVPMIAACGDDEKPQNSGTKETQNENKGPLIDKDDPLLPEINEHIEELAKDNNFNGATFTYIGSGAESPTDDEETGDIQNDALYYRQREIEDTFGVKWSNYKPESTSDEGTDAVVEAVKEDVLSGSGAYDAGYGMTHTCHGMLMNSLVMDTSEFTAVDLDRDWWTQSIRDTFNLNGALYFLNGSILSYYYQDAFCVIFNKQVASDYGVDEAELYELVKNGEWTFDKMLEVAEKVPENANASGAYRFGDPDAMATILAHGMTIVKFDEDGAPYVEDSVSVELSNLADKFSKIFGDDTLTANIKRTKDESTEEKYGYESLQDMFADDQILFLFIPTDEAAWLRVQDVEFGILPMPKASVQQENHISYCTSRSAFHVYVPKTTKDVKMTDVILEAMGALGYKYIKPAFYDKILKSRSVHDKKSKDMIDIVFATKKYDLIDMVDTGVSINGAGDVVVMLEKAIQETSDGLTSDYLMRAMMVNMQIQELLAEVEANN